MIGTWEAVDIERFGLSPVVVIEHNAELGLYKSFAPMCAPLYSTVFNALMATIGFCGFGTIRESKLKAV